MTTLQPLPLHPKPYQGPNDFQASNKNRCRLVILGWAHPLTGRTLMYV